MDGERQGPHRRSRVLQWYRSVLNRWLPHWRREALRTTLWVVPMLLVAAVVVLFAVTYGLDRAAYDGDITFPSWVQQESADAARQLLSAIAAAVITVVGVVFSVTIVALTLASQQFGPRMLRNFIRDLGTQMSLGAFVATFVYDVLALGSIFDSGRHGPFVPHLSITVALVLLIVDLVVLIYFIHHIAVSIQLPQVIAAVSKELGRAVDIQFPEVKHAPTTATGPSLAELHELHAHDAVTVTAERSGYLQFVRYEDLVDIAGSTGSVIRLVHRPGHFITAGLPLATVWPTQAGPAVTRALRRAHVPGAHRTVTQDPVFPIDQLVEIAIRALSPAVNDTFTALTCIDWLSDGLCKISQRHLPLGIHRDDDGAIRVIEPGPDYSRIVNRASDKVRQASRAMPAVAIRQLDGLAKVLRYTTSDEQRDVLRAQADRILRASDSDVPEIDDRADLRRRHQSFLAVLAEVGATHPARPAGAGGAGDRTLAGGTAPVTGEEATA